MPRTEPWTSESVARNSDSYTTDSVQIRFMERVIEVRNTSVRRERMKTGRTGAFLI
jgi:hypothetical protein